MGWVFNKSVGTEAAATLSYLISVPSVLDVEDFQETIYIVGRGLPDKRLASPACKSRPGRQSSTARVSKLREDLRPAHLSAVRAHGVAVLFFFKEPQSHTFRSRQLYRTLSRKVASLGRQASERPAAVRESVQPDDHLKRLCACRHRGIDQSLQSPAAVVLADV
jgi:hypothetical protein